MNWNEIGTQILLYALGLVFSIISIYVTYLIKKHITNENAKAIVTSFNNLVRDNVIETYQVYVEALKKAGKFDAEAQKQALKRSLDNIKANIPSDVNKWLNASFSDVDEYIKQQIEVNIGLLKKTNQ